MLPIYFLFFRLEQQNNQRASSAFRFIKSLRKITNFEIASEIKQVHFVFNEHISVSKVIHTIFEVQDGNFLATNFSESHIRTLLRELTL